MSAAPPPTPTLGPRLVWALRLLVLDVRRHRGGVLLGVMAFALATSAILGSTGAYAAWRA